MLAKFYMRKNSAYKTWLQVWMHANSITRRRMARILMCSEQSLGRWINGAVVNPHFANLIRALWPECPVNLYGGPATPISEPIPANARTVTLYKFIFKISGMIETRAYPAAMEYVRREHSEASEAPVAGAKPHA